MHSILRHVLLNRNAPDSVRQRLTQVRQPPTMIAHLVIDALDGQEARDAKHEDEGDRTKERVALARERRCTVVLG